MAANVLLKDYVVNSVSGDYENMQFLRSRITQWPEEYRRAFSEEALLAAIDEAIEDDLIRVYKYNVLKHSFEKCDLQMRAIDDYWFLKKGTFGYPHNL